MLLVATTFTLFAPRARAQGDDVERLVREEIDLRKEQREAEALARFEQAYARAPSPHIEAQMGLAERALRSWAASAQHLREALASTTDPWVEKNREALVFGLTTVEKHLGSLDVEVSAAGAELWINGVRASALPLEAPVRIGEGPNAIEVRAPGFVSITRRVDIVPSERVRIVLTLTPETSPVSPSSQPAPPVDVVVAAPTPAAERATSSPTARTLGFVVGGVGLAGIATGAIFGGFAIAKRSELSPGCTQSGQCGTEPDRSTNTTAHTDATVSTIALAAGAAALATGIVLVVTAHRPTTPSALHVVPLFGAGSAGAQVVTSF